MKRYLTIFLALVAIMGCETQNPICNDLWCVTGEVYPRSELDDGTAFDEVNVETRDVLGVLGNTKPVMPVETMPVESGTFADIIADTAAGGTQYAGEVITTKATVLKDVSGFTSGSTIALATGNDDVTFVIQSRETPDRLSTYKANHTYTFTLFVRWILPPENEQTQYTIIANIPTGTLDGTLNALIADVSKGNRGYIDKIVSLNAAVQYSTDTIGSDTETLTLKTNDRNVRFFVINRTSPPSRLDRYREGISYDFKVFIRDIRDKTGGGYTVYSHFVVE